MRRPKITCDIESGEITITIRVGDVDDHDPGDVPEAAWDAYVDALDKDNDGQRAALGQQAAADAAWNGRFGDFGGRIAI